MLAQESAIDLTRLDQKPREFAEPPGPAVQDSDLTERPGQLDQPAK
jgi:hypothetical protein